MKLRKNAKLFTKWQVLGSKISALSNIVQDDVDNVEPSRLTERTTNYLDLMKEMHQLEVETLKFINDSNTKVKHE